MMEIDGIPVTPAEYQMLRFVIINEQQVGWAPNKKDIRALIESGQKPSAKQRADMKTFSKAMSRSYRLNER